MSECPDRLSDRLSDKEKEVLRLFGRGHDAKSTANTLGLSVHTINERLRAARRKLDVTSSRQAARWLFEVEGEGRVPGSPNAPGAQPPQKSGSEFFGDAPKASSPDPASRAAMSRRVVFWIGGIFVMLTLALAAALMAPASQAPEPTGSQTALAERSPGDPATPIEAAQLREFERAARDWLALVDQSDWDASFSAAGPSFKKLNTVATWREASRLARVPLGDVVERATDTAVYVNAPPHGYVIVSFRTDFAQRAGALEKVTLERDEAGWKVVGYVID